MSKLDNDLKFLLIVVMGFGLMFGGLFITSKIRCESKAKALGYSCDYKLYQGCLLIKPDGKRVLLEQLRDFDN